MQLPLAYRSLSRPSSPLCAQASSIRFLSLDAIRCQAENFRNRPWGLLRLRAILRVIFSYKTKLNHNVDSLSHNHYLFPLSKSELPVSAGAAQNKAIEIEIDECVETVDFH